MRSDNTLIEARCRHEAMDSELSAHHEHPSHGDVVSQAAPLCIPKTCVGWPSIPAVMPRSALVSREGVLPCRYSNIVFLRVATHSVGSGGRKSGSHHALSTKEKAREEEKKDHRTTRWEGTAWDSGQKISVGLEKGHPFLGAELPNRLLYRG